MFKLKLVFKFLVTCNKEFRASCFLWSFGATSLQDLIEIQCKWILHTIKVP